VKKTQKSSAAKPKNVTIWDVTNAAARAKLSALNG